VPKESTEERNFFLNHFKASFLAVNDPLMVIISDHGKGLDSAVPTYLLLVTYCHCTQHICNNIMKNFHPGKDVRKLFWQAIHAPLELSLSFRGKVSVINRKWFCQ
jgi:hypothetical protein